MKLELFIKSVLLVMSLNFELRSFDNIGMYKKNHKRSLDTLKIATAYSQKLHVHSNSLFKCFSNTLLNCIKDLSDNCLFHL